MKMFRECPETIKKTTRYHCRLLEAVRDGQEEAICSVCPSLYTKMKEEELLYRAFHFAARAHRGQYRKGTDIPYLIHLVRTWGYVCRMTEDGTEQAAALLHDVLEDTEVTEAELREEFGDETAFLVVGESEYKRAERPAGETWQIRKQETIERLRGRTDNENDLAAMRIAFADKLANLYSMMFEYRRTGEQLWKKFNQKKKEMHAWYYGEMGLIFAQYFQKQEPVLLGEYRKYYEEVFGRYEIQVDR